MIDVAVQTLWTKPNEVTTELRKAKYFGFDSMDHFMASAYLSFVELKKKGYRVHLYTDNYGKELLVKKLQLNYDYVDTSYEHIDLNPKLWAYVKLYTHLKQFDPYLHIDLDAFVLKDFDETYKQTNLVFQNVEHNYEFYRGIWNGVDPYITENDVVSHYIRAVMNGGGEYSAMNVGIFGGMDIPEIHRYASASIEFMKNNSKMMPPDLLFYFCIFMEQMYSYYYFKVKNISTKPLYTATDMKVDDFLDWENYVHLISAVKTDPKAITKMLLLAKEQGYDS